MTPKDSGVSTLTATDDTALFVRDWPCDSKAGVVIMHGLGEHSGRYAHVAHWFNELGYRVRCYDHRGHGRSGGARGDLARPEALLEDAKLVIEDFARTLATPPLLLGHSMGGLFAATFALRRFLPLGGLILSSPALRIPLSAAQKLLLRMLTRVAPGLGIANGLDPRFLSHRQEVVDAYIADPLVHRKISARLLNAMLAAAEFSQAQASALRIRTLLLVAGEDHLVDANGSKSFHANLEPELGTLRYYPGYYHELFNEVDAGQVFDDMRAWLKARP